jgi:N-methylhydantoinase A/oxoprolinase/acetone carboxylase beta subunit
VPHLDCRLGIDVGGTNTDAVILDAADRVLAKAKVACTPDITGGITEAVDVVLRAPGVDSSRITHVMLGTTHATNAVLERRKLRRVAVIRIGSPATHAVRPMFGWPDDLADAVCVDATIVGGGIEFDGRDLAPLDGDAIARFLGDAAARGGGLDGVAVASVFAPVSPRHELLAAEIVKRELGEVHVSLSQAQHQPERPVAGLADPVGQGQVHHRVPAPGHLHGVLVAGLRRPVLVVHQLALHRETAVLQPLVLLRPRPGHHD